MKLSVLFVVSVAILGSLPSAWAIVEGKLATVGEYRHLGALNISFAVGRGFCGGSLIHTEWIVTAGQCVYEAVEVDIAFGSHILTGDNPNRKVFSTRQIDIHPEYDPLLFQHDIALIRLHAPVQENDFISIAKLDYNGVIADSINWAAGWGQTSDETYAPVNELQQVQLKTISHEDCQAYYGNYISRDMFCAVGRLVGGICAGDTGGSFSVEVPGRYPIIMGIGILYSANGCETYEPSVFVRLFNYWRWLDEYVHFDE